MIYLYLILVTNVTWIGPEDNKVSYLGTFPITLITGKILNVITGIHHITYIFRIISVHFYGSADLCISSMCFFISPKVLNLLSHL